MTRRLENKTALVTGSTSNIGRQIAVAFGSEGAHVIVSGRDDARGREPGTRAGGIRAAGRAHRHPGQQRRDLPGHPAR